MPLPLLQRRSVRIALIVAGLPLTVLVVAGIALAAYDWNGARPWLNERIGEALDRPFAIRGPLALTWQRQGSGADRTWRDYLPLPHLVARDVHIGPPRAMAAADGGRFASVAQFAFAVELLPLLRHRIVVPVLRFEQPELWLRRDAEGRNNWTFHRDDHAPAWQLAVQRVVLTRGTVHYRDESTDVDAVATVESIAPVGAYGVAWTLRGAWNGQPISGQGKSGTVLGLQEHAAPFPLAASLDVGGTRIAAEGTLTRPADLTALDLRLKMAGPSMARLYGITGVLLPETPAFATEGRLTGTINRAGSHWVYQDFTGRVGSSDIAGKLDYRTAQPRPVLSGEVRSKLLQFVDLGPLVGADSNASKRARGVDTVQPGNRALPVEAFRTERWTALDADVKLQAQRITRGSGLPVQNVETQVHMKDGVLSLKPLKFDIAGGSFTSDIVLDGSGKVDPHAIRAKLTADARHLQLKQLFPDIDGMRATVGEVDADVALTAKGNSVADLLGSSNGDFKGAVNGGSVSKLMLEEMGLNLGSVVVTRLFGDEQVKLNCLVADFSVRDGLMRSRLFVVDTAEASIDARGTVNLANEKLDLTLQPDAKSMRILSLRSPIYVRGTFKDTDVSIDKRSMALRAGGAVALALVAPVAAIVPLVSTAPAQTPACRQLLARVGVKPGNLPH
ncbi:MAG: AsmA family protein [Duganella sp.]